ncbi:MAG: alkaline phosphatase family protein, partial [Tepidisphaeraceae bacterium]
MQNRLARKLLLVGWDAADWRLVRPLMDKGWIPHLKKLVDAAASGKLASAQPMICPMLWTSVATGKRAHRHGIHGFAEPRPGGDGIRAAASTSRTSKAIWNILTQCGLRTHVINWYASHPPEPINGVCVSNRFAILPSGPARRWPEMTNIVHPQPLADAICQLRIRPEELDPSVLLPFVPTAAGIDQESDRRLMAIAILVARASNVHAAATWAIENEPWDFAAVLYDGIEEFCRQFMEYSAPQRGGTSQKDFETYQHVVTAAYRFHDMMLGRLVELAGADTTVLLVSDHGYHGGDHHAAGSSHSTDDVSADHRPQGIWAMRGPRVKRGAEIVGATLLDVTPTILTLFGLPSGSDMPGRPWVEAIDARGAAMETDRILSWDQRAGEAGMHPPGGAADDAESRETIDHLIELGYAVPENKAGAEAANHTREMNRHHLARALIDAGENARAVELLEPLLGRHPTHIGYAQTLFQAYLALGRHGDARRIAEDALLQGTHSALAHLALGAVDLAERRPAAALEHLEHAQCAHTATPALHVLIGRGYLRLRRWEEAERAFRLALQLDADSEAACHGLATVALARERNEEAAELALRAVGLRPEYPEAHYHLGIALMS